MRFDRLRLSGFKSFVDPTELVIAEGLTGVVGPNGCGKSNLLEALRWVMGENRPTAMRGGGMEDVIFAGAATRPARNFAEVSLVLDNSERLAPAGFNDSDQLEVVRRITRDVGSAYKANAKDVRARDIQMLFADASTGAHSPALVRQGQISELINARPQARRRILEEAAGISGLYQRRHEAELKLNGAEANLSRVDDVLEQLAQQLGQLARQARQAARYEEAEIGKTLFHFAAFGRSRDQAALALTLVRNLRGNKGLQVVAGGKLTQDAFRAEAVLECYLEASGLPDHRAHCVQIVHETHLVERYLSGRSSLAPSIDVADVMRNAFGRDEQLEGKVYEFPCRHLLARGFKFQPGHPSSEADQLLSAAIREGCDWCPCFPKEEE